MKAAASGADNEQFLQADMRVHQTIWKVSRREQLYRTLNSVMNPFIFMVARAYASQTPIAERYKHRQDYLNIVLTSPISRVNAGWSSTSKNCITSSFGTSDCSSV